MKNPYKKGKVHPSPPPSTPNHYLSLLPATILTLTADLPLQDKQVLAYLISCCGSTASTASSTNWRATQSPITGDDRGGRGRDHGPAFGCDCFRCYMSYWVRWDASPNRQVIHEVIEAYEEELLARDKMKKKVVKKKKERGKNVCDNFDEETANVYSDRTFEEGKKREGFMENEQLSELEDSSCSVGQSEDVQAAGLDNNGTVRKIFGFFGQQIWGFWSRD